MLRVRTVEASEAILSTHYHAVVWIDHREARVIYFNADAADEQTIHPARAPRHLRATSGSPAGTYEHGDATYFRDVAEGLGEAKAFLVAGPSIAKTEFVTWLRKHAPQTAERMSGVEPLAHMTDGQIIAEARRFFKGADLMRPQTT
jgi:hypothetical protein